MSLFSLHERKQFRQLFERFSEFKHKNLTAGELFCLMTQIGPMLPWEKVQQMYEVFGTDEKMGFEQCLALLQEYYRVKRHQDAAFKQAWNLLAEEIGENGKLTRTQLQELLQTGPLPLNNNEVESVLESIPIREDDEPEACITEADITQHVATDAYVFTCKTSIPKFEDRLVECQINVHVLLCTNTTHCLGTKVRAGVGIQYHTLDPLVVVSMGPSISESTNVLMNQPLPEWRQHVTLTAKWPTTSISDPSLFVSDQHLTFQLFDFMLEGVTPQQVLIGSASMPVSRILSQHGKAQRYSLRLKCPELMSCVDVDPRLEVVLSCPKDTLSLLPHMFEVREDLWNHEYTEKLQQDLAHGLKVPDAGAAAMPPKVIGEGFYGYYREFYSELRAGFSSRAFQIIGLDEYNVFHCLSCFVTPLTVPGIGNDKFAIANAVARIPSVPTTLNTQRLPNTCQVCSPSVMLYRQYGTDLEHALLLCDLFLGAGLDAYVCLGQVCEQMRAWVVTFESLGQNTYLRTMTPASRGGGGGEGHLSHLRKSRDVQLAHKVDDAHIKRLVKLFVEDRACDIKGEVLPDCEMVRRARREREDDRQATAAFHRTTRVTHWDPLTGRHCIDVNDSDFNYDTACCLFNHRSLLVNVQPTDVAKRVRWDIGRLHLWKEFLTPAIQKEFGPAQCWYSEPIFDVPLGPNIMESTLFLHETVSAIQTYRKNRLYIPTTAFHRSASAFLQQTLATFPPMPIPLSEQKALKKTITNGLHKHAPEHTLWRGKHLHLTATHLDDIIETLVSMGLLDCSVADVAFTIGTNIYNYPLGVKCIWLSIGWYIDAASLALKI